MMFWQCVPQFDVRCPKAKSPKCCSANNIDPLDRNALLAASTIHSDGRIRYVTDTYVFNLAPNLFVLTACLDCSYMYSYHE